MGYKSKASYRKLKLVIEDKKPLGKIKNGHGRIKIVTED